MKFGNIDLIKQYEKDVRNNINILFFKHYKEKIFTSIVLAKYKKYILVDIGFKNIFKVQSIELLDFHNISIGDSIDIFIDNLDFYKNIICSERKCVDIRTWGSIVKAYKSNCVLICMIKEKIRGGFIVLLQNFNRNAFLPKSHVTYVNVVDDFSIKVVIISLDEGNKNVIVSQKEAIGQIVLSHEIIKVGAVINAKIIKIYDFGISVDLGDVSGMIYNNEISWYKNDNNYSVEDYVNVNVLSINGNNILLSIKNTIKDPLLDIHIGDIVENVLMYKINSKNEDIICKIFKNEDSNGYIDALLPDLFVDFDLNFDSTTLIDQKNKKRHICVVKNIDLRKREVILMRNVLIEKNISDDELFSYYTNNKIVEGLVVRKFSDSVLISLSRGHYSRLGVYDISFLYDDAILNNINIFDILKVRIRDQPDMSNDIISTGRLVIDDKFIDILNNDVVGNMFKGYCLYQYNNFLFFALDTLELLNGKLIVKIDMDNLNEKTKETIFKAPKLELFSIDVIKFDIFNYDIFGNISLAITRGNKVRFKKSVLN